MNEFLPLSHFIQRSRVLSLYRRTLRSATKQSQLSFKERKQIKQQITAEYRKHQHLTDQPFIRQCLVQAENQAKFLESGLGAQNPSIIDDEVDKLIEEAVSEGLAAPKPTPDALMKDVYINY